MVFKHLRNTASQPLARFNMQELIRPMCIGFRAEQSCNQELRFRETLAQHAHEGDRATRAHVHRRFAEERFRRLLH